VQCAKWYLPTCMRIRSDIDRYIYIFFFLTGSASDITIHVDILSKLGQTPAVKNRNYQETQPRLPIPPPPHPSTKPLPMKIFFWGGDLALAVTLVQRGFLSECLKGVSSRKRLGHSYIYFAYFFRSHRVFEHTSDSVQCSSLNRRVL
jgi:hypothetical protein